MKIETKEILKALKPFRNGCSYRTEIKNGEIKILTGCYHLINLLTGAEKYLQGLCGNTGYVLSQDHLLEHVEEVKLAILSNHEPCKHCSNELYQKSEGK
tara:strand:- start:1686 stop:1982 length:297 start_codon:yes stop_codon:yes gene_type:complete